MWTADGWRDFEVLDAADGEKLERWGKFYLVRPDPQVIWHTPKVDPHWKKPDALYRRSSSGGGAWQINRLPESFCIQYGAMTFQLKPMNFKHTGLFPEQAVNWDFAQRQLQKHKGARVLNMFAYTGGASIACAAAGAQVCHVDASRGMVAWAKENAALNGISDIRFIVDDCVKFAQREIRRGKKYDAIIMDPPSYGRGPGGEIWKLEDALYELLETCLQLLSDQPLFFLLNSYTTGLSAGCMRYMLGSTVGRRFGGVTEAEELGLPIPSSGFALPCGATARWYRA